MPLKALIVDDEVASRSELRFTLESYPEVEIMGESASAKEALKLINAVDYDILFIDIDMPDFSGIELAQKIQNLAKKPLIVFVTAYGEYALEAFEVNAIDYLLKPFSEDRFEQTMEKILRASGTSGKSTSYKEHNGSGGLYKIAAHKGGKTFLINYDDIVYAQAHGDYTYVFVFDDRYLCDFTLSEFEIRTGSSKFFRAHRSYVVNLDKVTQLSQLPGGSYVLNVDDKSSSEVPVSRRQGKQLKSLLGL